MHSADDVDFVTLTWRNDHICTPHPPMLLVMMQAHAHFHEVVCFNWVFESYLQALCEVIPRYSG